MYVMDPWSHNYALYMLVYHCYLITALQDSGERVRGWFPRSCVKIPNYDDSKDSDRASQEREVKSNHLDKETPESKPTTASPSKGEGKAATKRGDEKTKSEGGGAMGSTPTSGARKRSKKTKKKETKE